MRHRFAAMTLDALHTYGSRRADSIQVNPTAISSLEDFTGFAAGQAGRRSGQGRKSSHWDLLAAALAPPI